MPTATIKFIVEERKKVQTKIGACFFSENVSSLPSLTPLSAQLGLSSFYYADLKCVQDDAQAAIINAYITACNAKIGVFVSLEIDNYMGYLDWVVKVFGSKLAFIQMHQERLDITNELYVQRCHEMMNKYPNIIFSWNCGLLTKNDTLTKAINAIIAKQTGTDRGRQYQHMSDAFTITTNQVSNLAGIRNYIDTFLPKIQTDFKTLLPNLKQQTILQENEYMNSELLSPALTNYAIAEKYRFDLTNTECYSDLFRQSITNLIVRGAITPNYTSIKRLIPAFAFKYTVPITLTNLDGCSAQGFWDGKNSVSLLVTNQTSTEYTVAPTGVLIKGNSILGNITRDSGWATSLDAAIKNEIIAEPSIVIKPYSGSLFSFRTI